MTGFYSANRKGNILARQEYLCITETVIGKVTGSSGRALQFSSCNGSWRNEHFIVIKSNLVCHIESLFYRLRGSNVEWQGDKWMIEDFIIFLKHVRDLNNKKKVLLLDL